MSQSAALVDDAGWCLTEATDDDIDQLMSWFPDQLSVNVWGGPNFRFPFTRETFREDVRCNDMASYCLQSPDGEFVAFGQFYERVERINLARLVVHAAARGQGSGKRLIQMLMTKARPLFNLTEFSLFVFADNLPAHHCYKSMGFVAREYPGELPANMQVIYLTRPVTDLE